MPSSTSAWGCLLACSAQTLGLLLPFLLGSLFPKQEISALALVKLPHPKQASDLMTSRGWASGQGGVFEALPFAVGMGGRSNNEHPLRIEK